MTLLVLAETSAGYALFKAKDKKLLKRDSLAADIETAEGACSLLRLKQFQKFESATSALEEASALVEGKVTPMLASLLDSVKDEKKASLAVADPKLGNAINKLPSLSLKLISDSSTNDLYRAIRDHLTSLIPGLLPQDVSTMSLGLSHSLSRHKLKFSPDKVDVMIVQAIALLDDLDKELNTYAMRVKEWYGWHFPEMGRIVNDNVAYARVILKMGVRSRAAQTDLADILPDEIAGAVKAAAEISMGTDITSDDLDNIQALASQVVSFTEYRQQLASYLAARMAAIAPNLTALVGELVGARLIAHAGSLLSLAKAPASTIQILGAEKALFRALKTKHDTPKYGLIYHASLIGQATGKNKGKIARMLATKAALGLRVDALADWGTHGEGDGGEVSEEAKAAVGTEFRIMIERRLRALEGKPLAPRGVAIGPNGKFSTQPAKWEVKEARKYNQDADGLTGNEPAARQQAADGPPPVTPVQKQQDRNGKLIEELDDDDVDMESVSEDDGSGDDDSDDVFGDTAGKKQKGKGDAKKTGGKTKDAASKAVESAAKPSGESEARKRKREASPEGDAEASKHARNKKAKKDKKAKKEEKKEAEEASKERKDGKEGKDKKDKKAEKEAKESKKDKKKAAKKDQPKTVDDAGEEEDEQQEEQVKPAATASAAASPEASKKDSKKKKAQAAGQQQLPSTPEVAAAASAAAAALAATAATITSAAAAGAAAAPVTSTTTTGPGDASGKKKKRKREEVDEGGEQAAKEAGKGANESKARSGGGGAGHDDDSEEPPKKQKRKDKQKGKKNRADDDDADDVAARKTGRVDDDDDDDQQQQEQRHGGGGGDDAGDEDDDDAELEKPKKKKSKDKSKKKRKSGKEKELI